MIWHPRPEWVTTEPVTGPPLPWPDIDTVVIHYTAAPNLIDGDPGERWEQIPAYLRQIHHDYLTNRKPGYSIGYNVAVDARGDAWELRGFDIKAAATKGHNDHTWAILLLVDGQDPATPAAVATVNELYSQAEARAKRSLAVKGHRDFAATQCPGVGIYAQVRAGVFHPPIVAPPKPPLPPHPATGGDMFIVKSQTKGAALVQPFYKSQAEVGHRMVGLTGLQVEQFSALTTVIWTDDEYVALAATATLIA
jgi:hypothetical protein